MNRTMRVRWRLPGLLRGLRETLSRSSLFPTREVGNRPMGNGGRMEDAAMRRVTALAEYWPLSPLW
ncbi:MAG: hypothetical protein ACYTFG_04800 [Planctomycetota bacterium]|jgi:hypothetical protein